jgi:hypothetical protein
VHDQPDAGDAKRDRDRGRPADVLARIHHASSAVISGVVFWIVVASASDRCASDPW